jgi:hypothetical protein
VAQPSSQPTSEATLPPADAADDNVLPASDIPADISAEEQPAAVVEDPAAEAEAEAEVVEGTDEHEAPAAAPAPAPAPEPAVDSERAEASRRALQIANQNRQRQLRYQEITVELAELKKIKPEEFDPWEHGKKRLDLLAERQELQDSYVADLERVVATQQQANEEVRWWDEWGRKNQQIGVAEGKKIWDSELAKLQQKYPGMSPDAIYVAAVEGFETRVRIRQGLKNGKAGGPAAGSNATRSTAAPAPRPSPSAGAPRVSPGGSTVLPAARATTRPPAPKAMTYDQQLEQFAKMAGDPAKHFLRD